MITWSRDAEISCFRFKIVLFLIISVRYVAQINYIFFNTGLPYKHKILFAKGTPIWTTKVNCTGSEYKLSQCPNFTLGRVSDCVERYDAGVVCYSTVGK